MRVGLDQSLDLLRAKVGHHSDQKFTERRSCFALFLTHRRGAAVCVVDLETFNAADSLKPLALRAGGASEQFNQLRGFLSALNERAAVSSFQGSGSNKIESAEAFDDARCELIVPLILPLLALLHDLEKKAAEASDSLLATGHKGMALAMANAQTAELLWKLYAAALAAAQLRDEHVDLLVYAGGPVGSFTGLRIGASFVAGLASGRARAVGSVQTFDLEFLKSIDGACPWGLPQDFFDSGRGEGFSAQKYWNGYASVTNEYQLPVFGIEVLLGFCLVLLGRVREHSFSELHYASEPGPVLAMRTSERKM